jgi:hypothetical protein
VPALGFVEHPLEAAAFTAAAAQHVANGTKVRDALLDPFRLFPSSLVVHQRQMQGDFVGIEHGHPPVVSPTERGLRHSLGGRRSGSSTRWPESGRSWGRCTRVGPR